MKCGFEGELARRHDSWRASAGDRNYDLTMSYIDRLERSSATQVARSLRAAKPCVVLAGAGCSYSANVLLASEVVDYVRLVHPRSYRAASEDTHPELPGYAEVMKRLPGPARSKAFLQFVEHSHLNRAHAALGYLVRTGRVGRVLTTNFDDLLLRGCAFHGIYPPVYDLGMLGAFGETDQHEDYVRRVLAVIEPVVFHLHGRHNGAYQIHSEPQAEAQRMRLAPIVESARDRLWIVAGYSGSSDPLWQTLRRVLLGANPARMCWVNLAPPEGEVARDLARAGGTYVESDADSFFASLANALPPRERKIVHGAELHGSGSSARWLAHPVALAQETARNLGTAGAAKHEEFAVVSDRIAAAEAALAARKPRLREAWSRATQVLEALDPSSPFHGLEAVVGKRRNLHVRRDERRSYAQLVTRLRDLGGSAAAGLRLRAVEAATTALMRGAPGADASALQDWIVGAERRRPSPALALALARVLTLRIARKAAAEGLESPRLASSALKALERAWSGPGPENANLRRKLKRLQSMDDPARRVALAELLLAGNSAQQVGRR